MIRDIRQFIEERGRVSLREVAIHFRTDAEALEPILDVLVRKGQVLVERVDADAGCGACSKCSELDHGQCVIYLASGTNSDA